MKTFDQTLRMESYYPNWLTSDEGVNNCDLRNFHNDIPFDTLEVGVDLFLQRAFVFKQNLHWVRVAVKHNARQFFESFLEKYYNEIYPLRYRLSTRRHEFVILVATKHQIVKLKQLSNALCNTYYHRRNCMVTFKRTSQLLNNLICMTELHPLASIMAILNVGDPINLVKHYRFILMNNLKYLPLQRNYELQRIHTKEFCKNDALCSNNINNFFILSEDIVFTTRRNDDLLHLSLSEWKEHQIATQRPFFDFLLFGITPTSWEVYV